MFRGHVFAGLIIAGCLLAAGCGGGSEYSEQAQRAKPVSIGTPDKWPMGAAPLDSDFWVVKVQEEGETRLRVLTNSVPRLNDRVQYDADKEMFYDKGRAHRYDMQGNALHTVPKGPNQGLPGMPLELRPVELDSVTGEVMVYKFKTLPEGDRSNPGKGAWVVVG